MKTEFCKEYDAGSNIFYEIVDHIGVINQHANGWRKELNRVRWNGADVKYDIREWSEDHEKMSKGLTLTTKEFNALAALMESRYVKGQ